MKHYSICVYPYNHEFDPILNYIDMLLPEYSIEALAAPKGFGLSKEKPRAGERTFSVYANPGEVLENINCVWIPDLTVSDTFEPIMISQIIKALPRLNKIICCVHLKEENLERLKKECSQAECQLELLEGRPVPDFEIAYDIPLEQELLPIEVPSIAVTGMWEGLDKFNSSLVLRDRLLKEGYKVSQIGSKNFCEMLGFHSFPGFMMSPFRMNGTDQIYNLNRYVYEIVEKEQPDVLLITIPGALQSFNEKFSAGFGVLPHLVFQAVRFDFMLLCSFYNFNPRVVEFYKMVSEACRFKMDCPIDCVHMSNYFIDSTTTAENKVISGNRMERERVDQAIGAISEISPIPVYNLFREDAQNALWEQIIGKLTNKNAEVMVG